MNDEHALLGFGISDGDEAPKMGPSLERTNSHALAQIAFTVSWQCENARHSDTLISRRFNFWRDILPAELEADLLDRPCGHSASHHFAAGELIDRPAPSDTRYIRNKAFDRSYRQGHYVEPRSGRFYPRGFIAGTANIYPGDVRPFRVTEVKEDQLGIDLSHPLAGRELQLSARIQEIRAAGEDVAELVCDNGPGMQTRSIRGLPRPPEDPHYAQRDTADPAFAVWGITSDREG